MGLSVLIGMTVLRGMSSPLVPQTGLVTLEQEVVASHVRALISTRTIDVLSTDQHTVKPWFNGRIDYAPPVADTTAHGFPLVGGRIDYVGERPVAVVVYRYLQHPIDLYIFPKADAASSPGANTTSQLNTMSRQGYSLVEWNQGGMVFWAITDASMSSLKLFADAVKQLTPS
jgi:anti-sigma factor RsiW